MSERRFSDAEVATIIDRATTRQESSQPTLPSGGMTLAQLQEIGREVGLDPRAIADAARTIDEAPAVMRPGPLGMPLRVERTVAFDRKLSEEEWERMVVDLRETFNARGVMRTEGSLRHWANGNLQALLEPTATGQRVRIRTFRGDAIPRLLIGSALVVGTVVAWLAEQSSPSLGPLEILFYSSPALAGIGIVGTTLVRVRQWAARRREQMNALAERWSQLKG